MSDHYRTLAEPAEGRARIQRSAFLARAFPCASDEEFFAALRAIEKQYFDATHHCWAFRLFGGGTPRQRSSDAGEPSGSAGRPILSAIEGADLFDCGVVVVRWYGGVKLGTGGLSRVYRQTAAETLRAAAIVERLLYERYEVEVPFQAAGVIYRLIEPPDVVLRSEPFVGGNIFAIDVRRSRADSFERALTEGRLTFSRPTPR